MVAFQFGIIEQLSRTSLEVFKNHSNRFFEFASCAGEKENRKPFFCLQGDIPNPRTFKFGDSVKDVCLSSFSVLKNAERGKTNILKENKQTNTNEPQLQSLPFVSISTLSLITPRSVLSVFVFQCRRTAMDKREHKLQCRYKPKKNAFVSMEKKERK